MPVTIRTSATNGQWFSLEGTLQEVVDEAADQRARRAVGAFWDNVNGRYGLIICRFD